MVYQSKLVKRMEFVLHFGQFLPFRLHRFPFGKFWSKKRLGRVLNFDDISNTAAW